MSDYTAQTQEFLSNQTGVGKVLDAQAGAVLGGQVALGEDALEAQLGLLVKAEQKTRPMLEQLAAFTTKTSEDAISQYEKLAEKIRELFQPSSLPKIYSPIGAATEELESHFQTKMPVIFQAVENAAKSMDLSISPQSLESSLDEVYTMASTKASEIGNSIAVEVAGALGSDSVAGGPIEVQAPIVAEVVNDSSDVIKEALANVADSSERITEAQSRIGDVFNENFDLFKASLIQAVSEAQSSFDPKVDVTLEIDGRQLASILMTKKTPDGQRLVTYSETG
jgi:hypothetical protein